MGVAKGQGHTVGPVSNWLTSFTFHTSTRDIFPDVELFWNSNLKIQGQGHELGNRSQISPSIQSMDFLFVLRPPDQPSPSYHQ